MNDLETALYGKLTGSSSLLAKLASVNSVYAYSAPENASLPVIVFFQQSGDADYTFSQRAYNDLLYAIKAISEGDSMHVASEIDEAIDALLTDSTLTVGSGTSLYCRRESSISPYVEVSDGVRYNHAGGSYRIWIGA